MSISTRKAAKSDSQFGGHRTALTFGTMLLPALVMGGAASQKRPKCRLLIIFFAIPLFVIFASCGGVSSGAGDGGGGSGNPVTYQVTVTGTSPGTPSDPGQSTVVTLVVD
jgi:hypothetical protein